MSAQPIIIPTLADRIRPAKKGVSDFFSWNLYRFAQKHPNFTRVYLMQREADSAPRLYLGYPDRDGSLLGNGLNEILRERSTFPLWSMALPDNAKEVTADFWAYYEQTGACTLDNIFYHAWQANGDGETCAHCQATRTPDPDTAHRYVSQNLPTPILDYLKQRADA